MLTCCIPLRLCSVDSYIYYIISYFITYMPPLKSSAYAQQCIFSKTALFGVILIIQLFTLGKINKNVEII